MLTNPPLRSLKDLPLPVTWSMPPYARVADKIGDILLNLRDLEDLLRDLRSCERIRGDVSAPVEDFVERVIGEATSLMADLTE